MNEKNNKIEIVLEEGKELQLVITLKVITPLQEASSKKNEYKNKKEICKYVNACNNTVTKWIEQEGFPVNIVQGKYSFNIYEVDEWRKKTGRLN